MINVNDNCKMLMHNHVYHLCHLYWCRPFIQNHWVCYFIRLIYLMFVFCWIQHLLALLNRPFDLEMVYSWCVLIVCSTVKSKGLDLIINISYKTQWGSHYRMPAYFTYWYLTGWIWVPKWECRSVKTSTFWY